MTPPVLVSYLLLWLIVGFQAVVLVGLILSVQKLQRRSGPSEGHTAAVGLTPGTEVPWFSARDVNGLRVTTDDLRGRLTGLLFVGPNCSTCHTALEGIVGLSHKVRGNVVVICQGPTPDCQQLAKTYELSRVIVDEGAELSSTFVISQVPTAIVIDRSGRIQSYGQPFNPTALEDAPPDVVHDPQVQTFGS
jgi:methylamine dehydrogenase accessory protein MauD